MKQSLKLLIVTLVLTTSAGLLGACGSTAPTAQPPVVVTVPVEVTRVVSIPQTVEVTRQVVLTATVEVPVTVTPTATPEITSTPLPTETPTYAPVLTPLYSTPTFPENKTQGFSYIKITNMTGDKLTLEIQGPTYASIVLSAGAVVKQNVLEAEYTYTVYRNDRAIFRGTMVINNPDKYELHIHDDRVNFLMP